MKRSNKGSHKLVAVAMAAWLWAAPALGEGLPSDLRYPLDLAEHIYSAPQIQQVLNLDEALVSTRPEPILISRPVPLEELGVAPSTTPVYQPRPNGAWEIPPFPEVEPPPPAGLSPQALEAWKKSHERASGDRPKVFGDISSEIEEVPSARLRPRVAMPNIVEFKDFALPPPFSAARFVSNRRVFQLSLYAGTTSFEAERVFMALRHSVQQKEALEGFGREAFMGHYKEVDPNPVAPITPDSHPFAEVEMIGKARPEQLDEGLQRAKQAPSFGDVPTTLHRENGAYMAKIAPTAAPRRMAEYLLLVAYVPEKAITYELALDSRMGTPQNLLTLALSINRRILDL